MKKLNQILTIALSGCVIFGLSVFAWVKAPQGYSVSERRALQQLPKTTTSQILSGKFMTDFEAYAMDQFPMRDGFRTFKSFASQKVFLQKDNHGLYSIGPYLSKMEYPLNKVRLGLSVKKIREIQKSFLEGTECKTYLCVIPDKNCFLAPLGGYPMMDYEALMNSVKDQVDADYIDISDLLSLEDFYYTDQHWRQECIPDVAERIGDAMDPEGETACSAVYEEKIIDTPFYGAYVGQMALPYDADEIHYLENDIIRGCKVTSYNSGIPQEAYMYDLGKASGRDPYEMFLSGSDPLLVIENPQAQTDKELVVFRDSFGSSLLPLLAERYRKITVVDLRYMKSTMLSDYVTFENQDVLFLYSTLILNNSISM